MTELAAFQWISRDVPLTPCAAVALGAASDRLAERLLALPDQHLTRLTGLAGSRLLLIEGDTADLPWVNGLVYLGRSSAASSVLLPTALMPDIPELLLERAVTNRVAGPCALLPEPPLLIPLAAARTIDRGALSAWREVPT